MVCSTVSKRLSEFFDGVLDDGMSIQISQHLKQCENCRRELETLSKLHEKLNSLKRIPAPEYLHHLVQTRLSERKNNTWGRQIKDAFALRWSRIRTTEVQFYWTRALGIAMTTFFLFVISGSIDRFYPGSASPTYERSAINKEYTDQVCNKVSQTLGVFSITIPERNYSPALHDGYFLELGESAASDSDDYDFTVVTEVDPSGTGTIQNVIESPYDRGLLDNVLDTIALARFRPAYKDGHPVSSQMILKFNKTTVYE